MMKNKWLQKQEEDFRDFRFDLYGFRHVFDESVKKDASILEIGCGNGYFLERLAKLGYTNLFGVDVVEGAVNECQGRLPKVTIEKNDGHNLAFRDNVFDAIVMSHVLEHSPFPYIMLKEAKRVLKESGLIFIEVPLELDFTEKSAHFVMWNTKEDFNAFLHENNLEIIQSEQGYTKLDDKPIDGKERHYWVIAQ